MGKIIYRKLNGELRRETDTARNSWINVKYKTWRKKESLT